MGIRGERAKRQIKAHFWIKFRKFDYFLPNFDTNLSINENSAQGQFRVI